MAGSVTQTRTTNPDKVKTERIITLACTSDAAAGTIPDTTLAGLTNFVLGEVLTTPSGGGTAPSTQYRVQVVDANGAQLFLSGSARSLTVAERESGHATLGYFPPVDNALTAKIVATGSLAAANIGNSNVITVTLRFVKR